MKNSEQCTSLQEQAVESSQTSFWDTDQSLLSSGTNTLAKSLEPESQTDGLTECQCGKEMLDCSIHPNTKDEWIAFMQDSLAKILAKPVVKEALVKIQGRDFTDRSYGLQTRYSLDTCSWKMSQQSLVETTEICSEQSLEILPTEATIVSGVVYPLPQLVLITSEADGGYLHTPTATANQMSPSMVRRSGWWPTPNASDNRDRGNMDTPAVQRRIQKGKQISLSMRAGGKLNPVWVEWLMGWPLHHTDLKR